MNNLRSSLTTALFALFAVSSPAFAASSAASIASESLTTSVGSLSTSITTSSNGSSKATGVATGDYKLIEVAVLNERPGFVNLKFKALAQATATDEFVLTLPAKALEQSGLVAGNVVTARERSYGTQFYNTQTAAAFFLVVHDETYREMRSNAVAL
jgi:hypothetical protein